MITHIDHHVVADKVVPALIEIAADLDSDDEIVTVAVEINGQHGGIDVRATIVPASYNGVGITIITKEVR